MKKWLIVMFALLFVTSASALDFTCSFGDEILSNHIGLAAGNFRFGVTATGLAESENFDEGLKVTDWLGGIYAEVPVLKLSVIAIPLDAEVFLGAEYQTLIEGSDDWYFTPYTGLEIEVIEGISPRVEFRYNERDDIMPEWVLSAGVRIEI